jgi:hypothetical protein
VGGVLPLASPTERKEKKLAKAKEHYEGRLMCDGNGNLLAHEATLVREKEITVMDDEGDSVLDESGAPLTVRVPIFKHGKNHGRPVAADEDGNYVFVEANEPSHNDRHHERFVVVDATSDASNEGEEHHDAPTPDDPHYDESAENSTRLRVDADKLAAVSTGHTAAYKKEGE